MKFLFLSVLGLFLASSSYAACVNLSGRYILDDPSNAPTLTITQQACTTMSHEFSYPTTSQTLGKSYEMNGVVTMTNETAELKVYESSTISDTEMVAKVVFFNKAKQKSYSALSHFYLDAAGDIRTEYDYYDYEGKLYQQQKFHFINHP